MCRNAPNPRIVPGMVLAIEPMINMGTGDIVLHEDGYRSHADGEVSCHMEHTVAVFEDHTKFSPCSVLKTSKNSHQM